MPPSVAPTTRATRSTRLWKKASRRATRHRGARVDQGRPLTNRTTTTADRGRPSHSLGFAAQAARDQPEAAGQQRENDERVEQARRTKEDRQVRDDPENDDQRAARGEQPAQFRVAVEEQHRDADEQRDERNSESVVAEELPVAGRDGHLIEQQVPAARGHGEPGEELAKSARRAASAAWLVSARIASAGLIDCHRFLAGGSRPS